jgi:ketosteroid isomerase-like protein
MYHCFPSQQFRAGQYGTRPGADQLAPLRFGPMPSVTEDRDEILQLLYRYNHAIDSGDAEGWADTFTEDAVFDAFGGGEVITGREGLLAFAASVQGIRHVVMNPLIDVSGDTAKVRAYLMFLMGATIAGVGVYDDEVVRTPQGWRFAKRVFTADPPAS